jgi:SAM-dependent methyltransferase
VTAAASLTPLTIFGSLRWHIVQRIVREIRPHTILELGCGLGAFGERLAHMAQYTGVEPDETSFATAYQRISAHGGTVLRGDHHIVPDAMSYDLVCGFEVIEHMPDDKGTLAEWVELVRHGGHIMLSVPAFQDRFGPYDEVVGHYRRYSPEQMRELLAGAGLADIQTQLYGWPLGNVLDVIRNRSAARRRREIEATSPQQRTLASARTFRFGGALGKATEAATIPIRELHRLAPNRGTGLIAVARRPERQT